MGGLTNSFYIYTSFLMKDDMREWGRVAIHPYFLFLYIVVSIGSSSTVFLSTWR